MAIGSLLMMPEAPQQVDRQQLPDQLLPMMVQQTMDQRRPQQLANDQQHQRQAASSVLDPTAAVATAHAAMQADAAMPNSAVNAGAAVEEIPASAPASAAAATAPAVGDREPWKPKEGLSVVDRRASASPTNGTGSKTKYEFETDSSDAGAGAGRQPQHAQQLVSDPESASRSVLYAPEVGKQSVVNGGAGVRPSKSSQRSSHSRRRVSGSGKGDAPMVGSLEDGIAKEVVRKLQLAVQAETKEDRDIICEEVFHDVTCMLDAQAQAALHTPGPCCFYEVLALHYAGRASDSATALLHLCQKLWDQGWVAPTYALLLHRWLLTRPDAGGAEQRIKHLNVLLHGSRQLFLSDVHAGLGRFAPLWTFLAEVAGAVQTSSGTAGAATTARKLSPASSLQPPTQPSAASTSVPPPPLQPSIDGRVIPLTPSSSTSATLNTTLSSSSTPPSLPLSTPPSSALLTSLPVTAHLPQALPPPSRLPLSALPSAVRSALLGLLAAFLPYYSRPEQMKSRLRDFPSPAEVEALASGAASTSSGGSAAARAAAASAAGRAAAEAIRRANGNVSDATVGGQARSSGGGGAASSSGRRERKDGVNGKDGERVTVSFKERASEQEVTMPAQSAPEAPAAAAAADGQKTAASHASARAAPVLSALKATSPTLSPTSSAAAAAASAAAAAAAAVASPVVAVAAPHVPGSGADFVITEAAEMLAKIRTESGLLQYLRNLAALRGSPYIGSLATITQLRLKSELYSLTSGGGPHYAPRAVRSAAFTTLDALFPMGRNTRHAVRLIARVLHMEWLADFLLAPFRLMAWFYAQVLFAALFMLYRVATWGWLPLLGLNSTTSGPRVIWGNGRPVVSRIGTGGDSSGAGSLARNDWGGSSSNGGSIDGDGLQSRGSSSGGSNGGNIVDGRGSSSGRGGVAPAVVAHAPGQGTVGNGQANAATDMRGKSWQGDGGPTYFGSQ